LNQFDINTKTFVFIKEDYEFNVSYRMKAKKILNNSQVILVVNPTNTTRRPSTIVKSH